MIKGIIRYYGRKWRKTEKLDPIVEQLIDPIHLLDVWRGDVKVD